MLAAVIFRIRIRIRIHIRVHPLAVHRVEQRNAADAVGGDRFETVRVQPQCECVKLVGVGALPQRGHMQRTIAKRRRRRRYGG